VYANSQCQNGTIALLEKNLICNRCPNVQKDKQVKKKIRKEKMNDEPSAYIALYFTAKESGVVIQQRKVDQKTLLSVT
jgi:hypothetical protein